MGKQLDLEYYVTRKSKLLEEFDLDAQYWRQVIASQDGDDIAEGIAREAHVQFESLIPEIPYIGGDENPLTVHLVNAARCLALYRVLKERGWTAAETGKILYQAMEFQCGASSPPLPPSRVMSPDELMNRRREWAERSQKRRYSEDWVYEFVAGDGEEFDYGYDFSECGVQKFYRTQGADELLPYYCLLDYPQSRAANLGLVRTTTLAEGHNRCDHRFKKGRDTE